MSDARTVIADWLNEAAFQNGFENSRGKSINDHADDILAALAEAGFVIVPRVPTEKMMDAYGKLRTATAMAFPALCDMEMSPSLWLAMVEAANE